MKDRPYPTREEHERYQRARITVVISLLFYVHLAAYLVTNGVFLFLFGRVGLWWVLGLVAHGIFTFAVGSRLALWIDQRVRASTKVER